MTRSTVAGTYSGQARGSRQVQSGRRKHMLRQIVTTMVILVLIVVFLISQSANLAGTLRIVLHVPLQTLLVGALLVSFTYVAAAVSYVALAADRRIRFRTTLAVQVSSGITNRLLPVGLGAAGLYAAYLTRSGFKVARAAAVVAANDIMGAIGNFILVAAAVLTAPGHVSRITLPSVPWWYVWAAAAVISATVLLFFIFGNWRFKIMAFAIETVHGLRMALKPSPRTLISLLANMSLTGLNAVILCIVVAAAGGSMFWPLSVVILSIGIVLGAAVPTPGGVGGVEAGIFGGLVACGVAAAPALAATVLYRALTYWLPIVPGLIALPWVRKRFL